MLRLRLAIALVSASGVVCAASAALWVRSYFREERLRWNAVNEAPQRWRFHGLTLTSVRGQLHLESETVIFTEPARIAAARQWQQTTAPRLVEYQGNYGGSAPWPGSWSGHTTAESLWFGAGTASEPIARHGHRHLWYAATPMWFPALLFAAPPAWWLYRRRRRERRRRLANRLCVECGYDLRSSEGRCPECGQPMPAAVAMPAGGV
jgi:hypothetical protein